MKKCLYRRGDYIKVIKPLVFQRCGYPLSKEVVLKEISESDKAGEIDKLMKAFDLDPCYRYSRVHRKIAEALAYGVLVKREFGGRERIIHTIERPEIIGRIYKVTGKRVVKTGLYDKGWTDDSDPENTCPPALASARTHTILFVEKNSDDFDYDFFEIEAANVEISKEEATVIW